MKGVLAAVLLWVGLLSGKPSCKAQPDFDFARKGPVEFLHFLRDQIGPSGVYTFARPMNNWIRRDQLAELVALVESDEPCGTVVLSHSSTIVLDSTVGNEAAFLIDGFRRGRYPPELHSGAHREGRKADVLAWWRAEQGRSGRR